MISCKKAANKENKEEEWTYHGSAATTGEGKLVLSSQFSVFNS